MKKKQQTSFEKNIVALANLLKETDSTARKVLLQNAGDAATLSALRNCVDGLNKYTAERKWEKDYVKLKNSIVQGEATMEVLKQTGEEKASDVQGQYSLLEKLKEKIGTDPANRDLIEQIQQMQKVITLDTNKAESILALEKALEQVTQERRKKLQKAVAMKNMMDYLFVMALYEQRLGLCALTNPAALIWSQLAKELHISTLPERERTSIFDFLGKQKLAPAARKIYDSLHPMISESVEKTYDISTKESRQVAKKDAITKLRKITKLEELCREALHEDSAQYKELMKAQNALLVDGAEEMSLSEMQGKLQALQKASQKYMEARMGKGSNFDVPRREARLIYAAALHDFSRKFGQQLGEAMRYRDIVSLKLPADITKDYIKNSLAAMDMLVKEQTGVDLTAEQAITLDRKPVLDNRG